MIYNRINVYNDKEGESAEDLRAPQGLQRGRSSSWRDVMCRSWRRCECTCRRPLWRRKRLKKTQKDSESARLTSKPIEDVYMLKCLEVGLYVDTEGPGAIQGEDLLEAGSESSQSS